MAYSHTGLYYSDPSITYGNGSVLLTAVDSQGEPELLVQSRRHKRLAPQPARSQRQHQRHQVLLPIDRLERQLPAYRRIQLSGQPGLLVGAARHRQRLDHRVRRINAEHRSPVSPNGLTSAAPGRRKGHLPERPPIAAGGRLPARKSRQPAAISIRGMAERRAGDVRPRGADLCQPRRLGLADRPAGAD